MKGDEGNFMKGEKVTQALCNILIFCTTSSEGQWWAYLGVYFQDPNTVHMLFLFVPGNSWYLTVFSTSKFGIFTRHVVMGKGRTIEQFAAPSVRT